MIGNGFFLINGKGFRMSISLCASWKCLAKMVQFPGTSSRGRNGLVCGVASSKPCLEADAGVRMLSLAIHQVMIRRWYQCAQLWYVKVMGFKDDLDDLGLVWSCIYVLVEIPRISYVTTSSKYELMQFSHLSIVEFQSKPFFLYEDSNCLSFSSNSRILQCKGCKGGVTLSLPWTEHEILPVLSLAPKSHKPHQPACIRSIAAQLKRGSVVGYDKVCISDGPRYLSVLFHRKCGLMWIVNH